MKKALAVLAITGLAAAASADVIVVDISGWQADGGWNNAGNSSASFFVPAGSTVDNVEYNITYTANGLSWLADLVVSVNDSIGFVGGYMDMQVSETTTPGSTTVSGNFFTAPLVEGGPFVVTTGEIYVELYDVFNDGGIDETVSSGTITIHYTPVPAPGALAALGLAGLAARRRR